MLVYPVPVKGAYVLGVHSTLALSGHIKLGPTIFPAFSPENYDYASGVTLKGLAQTLQAYSHVALSKHTRSLISLFLSSELAKSISIEKLVTEASRI